MHSIIEKSLLQKFSKKSSAIKNRLVSESELSPKNIYLINSQTRRSISLDNMKTGKGKASKNSKANSIEELTEDAITNELSTATSHDRLANVATSSTNNKKGINRNKPPVAKRAQAVPSAPHIQLNPHDIYTGTSSKDEVIQNKNNTKNSSSQITNDRGENTNVLTQEEIDTLEFEIEKSYDKVGNLPWPRECSINQIILPNEWKHVQSICVANMYCYRGIIDCKEELAPNFCIYLQKVLGYLPESLTGRDCTLLNPLVLLHCFLLNLEKLYPGEGEQRYKEIDNATKWINAKHIFSGLGLDYVQSDTPFLFKDLFSRLQSNDQVFNDGLNLYWCLSIGTYLKDFHSYNPDIQSAPYTEHVRQNSDHHMAISSNMIELITANHTEITSIGKKLEALVNTPPPIAKISTTLGSGVNELKSEVKNIGESLKSLQATVYELTSRVEDSHLLVRKNIGAVVKDVIKEQGLVALTQQSLLDQREALKAKAAARADAHPEHQNGYHPDKIFDKTYTKQRPVNVKPIESSALDPEIDFSLF